MSRRPRVFAPGLLYHVIVRGNQRRKTFRSDDDYKAYLDRLEKYRAECHVRIYAYCLMPNHVHLLVETGSTPLAKFMQGLQQSYTQHFNRSYRKVGHLFQGRYTKLSSASGISICWRWFAISISIRFGPNLPHGRNGMLTAGITVT